ncbi:MAG: hypothetical protein RLZZ514_1285, partial [Actinomycetota bacterium]
AETNATFEPDAEQQKHRDEGIDLVWNAKVAFEASG